MNREVEVTNYTILQGLKTRLNEAKGRWVEELPSILWAHHTTPRTLINETSFSLVFGMEAMISIEIGLQTMQIVCHDESSNPVQLRANLDLL